MILGFKIGRRLTGVVGFDDERVAFHDSRYAIKRPEAQVSSFEHYVARVLNQLTPRAIYYYAPTSGQNTLAESMVRRLTDQAGKAGVSIRPLTKLEVFGSFGVLPPGTRRQLREIVSAIWPELGAANPHRQEALAEAAATALVGDLAQAWPPV